MGFLTGAYLKMMNARMRLQLQNQLTSVMTRMNRATKEMGQMERQLNRQQQMNNAQLRAQMQNSIFGFQRNMYSDKNIFPDQRGDGQKYDAAIYAQQQEAMQQFNSFQMMKQTEFAQVQSMSENEFEMFREAQLEPLKNLEQNLAIEKANIETRMKLIEGQEKAAEEMEKSSQKDFVPQYTGGGG